MLEEQPRRLTVKDFYGYVGTRVRIDFFSEAVREGFQPLVLSTLNFHRNNLGKVSISSKLAGRQTTDCDTRGPPYRPDWHFSGSPA